VSLGPWDVVLVVAVTLQSTVVAYVRAPRWKALVYAIPMPFSVASIALGQTVGTSQVAGLLSLLLYINLVRWLHQGRRVPIVPSIAVSGLLYAGIGAVVNPRLPSTDAAFWTAWAAVVAVGVIVEVAQGRRAEPGHRSPLPLPLKAAIVAGIVVALVLSKKVLGGFMATFPMVGLVAAYEARHSLWTLSRSGPAVVLGIGSMCAAMRLLQTLAGLSVPASVGLALFAWAAVALPLLTRNREARP
jgi:hypothetical protein